MEVKYVSPGKEIWEQDCIEKIEGFKLDPPMGTEVTCSRCGTIFDTNVWTPGLLKVENTKTREVHQFLLCRDCSLHVMEYIKRSKYGQL